jgi:hypothetical protein
MGITLRTTKLLWGKSANRCAICRNELVEEAQNEADDPSIVGDMAHIIARKESFTRGDYDSLTPEERDSFSNLILLCKIHHKIIDDQPAHYTVEELRRIKSAHEQWVAATLGAPDPEKQQDDQNYAGIVDEWGRRIDIDRWTARGTWIYSASGPTIEKKYHEELTNLSPWIISRLWPDRYPELNQSFFNFKAVLTDFLKVLNRHLESPDPDADILVTKNFFKIREWDPERYESLYKEYDTHVCLVGNLYTELTRAVNKVCDQIRKNLFRGFRVREGVVMVQRDMVNGFNSEHFRAVYTGEAAMVSMPYKGLADFKARQYKGDYVLRPEHLSDEK